MQMGVTGLTWTDFVVWSEVGYVKERVEFVEVMWAGIARIE